MNIYLRAFELDDYKEIHKWRNDKEINKYLSGNNYFVSSEREKKFIETKIFDDKKDIYLSICDSNNHQIIGFCSINNIDLRNLHAEWGGTLIGDKKYLGKSIGEQSAKIMLRFLFDNYPIHKCKTSCLEDHPATIKLFEKLGFIQDGILRDEVYKNGKMKNILLFSILRDEINDRF